MQSEQPRLTNESSMTIDRGHMPERDRRRSRLLSDRYAEILELPLPFAERMKRGLRQGATWGDAIALAMVKAAANGNAVVAREIRESTEGKAPQRPPNTNTDIKVRIIHIGACANEGTSSIVPRSYDEIVKNDEPR
jgi:hypothetical protein